MTEPKRNNLPIAVITCRITDAIDYIRDVKNIREVRGAERKLIDFNGQEYIIIIKIEQLLSLEISSFIIVPSAYYNPDIQEILKMVPTRIK